MVRLSRTVRFALVPPATRVGRPAARAVNGYGGWPSMRGIGAQHELTTTVRGEPDIRTGYVIGINEIDDAVRSHVLPRLQAAFEAQWRGTPAEPVGELEHAAKSLASTLPVAVESLSWRLTPTLRYTLHTDMPRSFEIAQRFEFSASHRLHSAALDDETNRRVFGKCNSPHGHGHNYVIEVAVRVPAPTVDSPEGFGLPELESIVARTVIARLDHTHLNLDVPEFRSLNPTVERIAEVCHGMLAEPIRAAGGELHRVTLWETEKTSCSYPA